jgi:hypothetical protein
LSHQPTHRSSRMNLMFLSKTSEVNLLLMMRIALDAKHVCGQCQDHCITGRGVKLSDKIYNMAVFDRQKIVEFQELELLICKSCNAVITTKEHINYMHRKLGPKAFSSILNLNILNDKLRLSEDQDIKVEIKDGLKRKDMFNIICPNCLRQVLIKYL